MFVDVGKTEKETATNWVAESGVLDLFLLLGPSPHEVIPLSLMSEVATMVPKACNAHRSTWAQAEKV